MTWLTHVFPPFAPSRIVLIMLIGQFLCDLRVLFICLFTGLPDYLGHCHVQPLIQRSLPLQLQSVLECLAQERSKLQLQVCEKLSQLDCKIAEYRPLTHCVDSCTSGTTNPFFLNSIDVMRSFKELLLSEITIFITHHIIEG